MSSIDVAATNMSCLCQLTLDQVMYRGVIGPGTFYDRIMDPKLKNHLMNTDAINDFCEKQGRSIKILEYTPTSDEASSERLMLALKLTLEVLFMAMLPSYIPSNLRMTEFPKLRVLRSEYVNHLLDYPKWAEWTIFQNVEVFITPYRKDNTHWRNEMKEIAKLPMPANLMHFVFIIEKGIAIKKEELIREFGKQGIECHFATRLNHHDLLRLANGLERDSNEEVHSDGIC
ncbi:uncharacterized protein MELLADRAFT_114368 [Melampsora larici-populina 98AG31]|uniref:Uncharacterized protein n=1 Tax=Melampsora larici-populina (strain 98AG31 / pathotype 3-4-7) TaxID=747676 RepID=F4SD75_MELLP|nr:uncharacterized protein MELLADRAFT_114368 [Melampsora larici-populina 98AG31]EGF97407.1 hypothetical protein MELLADRAFT_114368 [Melampsora larici-populina 98AG31]